MEAVSGEPVSECVSPCFAGQYREICALKTQVFEEKHEPASGVDTELVDSLKALDPERPIREADIAAALVPL